MEQKLWTASSQRILRRQVALGILGRVRFWKKQNARGVVESAAPALSRKLCPPTVTWGVISALGLEYSQEKVRK
jgi:hypothetical protein